MNPIRPAETLAPVGIIDMNVSCESPRGWTGDLTVCYAYECVIDGLV